VQDKGKSFGRKKGRKYVVFVEIWFLFNGVQALVQQGILRSQELFFDSLGNGYDFGLYRNGHLFELV